MSTAPQTPLVEASSNDEVSNPLVPAPDSATNFADHRETQDWILANLVGLVNYVRGDYTAQHEEWGEIRRMALMRRDENASYNGQSKVYLPAYHRALETKVAHIGRGLFPSDSYFDVASENPTFEPYAPIVKAWMLHQLEKNAKIRSEMKPFTRQLLNYGMSVAKVWWEKPLNPIKNTRMTRLPTIQSTFPNFGESSSWTSEGARFKARNVFSWYIWPQTVSSLDEASVVFEDIQVSKQFIDEMGRKGIWKNTDLINQGGDIPETNNQLQQQLDEIRRSAETAVDTRMGELATWNYVTECWLRMPVPPALYLPNEVKGSPVPVKVVLCGGTPIEVRRNPFWHQKAPYLMTKINENPDSISSVGMGRAAAGIQYLINDMANQTNDNVTYSLNPIIKFNPSLIVGPMEPLAPGRMFGMHQMDAMMFDRPSGEQIQYGMGNVNQLMSYLSDLAGAPSVLQGSGTKGNAKTATGAQILQSNVKGDLQDTIEDIEQRVMTPLLDIIHSLGQQYETAQRFLAISGGEKVQFTRDLLEGEFAFRWVASSQAVNQAMRAQQSIQLLQVMGQMMPLLQQRGLTFNPEPLLRRIYEDGFGMRGFDRVIEKMPQAPVQVGQPGAPGAGPQPAAGDRVRSAVEQTEAGSGEMAPGEGEAFQEVRGNADDMAALLGVMGGGTE